MSTIVNQKLALELIAEAPYRMGEVDGRVGFLTLNRKSSAEKETITMGPSAAVPLHDLKTVPNAVEMVFEVLAEQEPEGIMMILWPAEHANPITALQEFRDSVDPHIRHRDHYGYYAVAGEYIHGLSAEGAILPRVGVSELGLTQSALRHAGEYPKTDEEVRVQRRPSDRTALAKVRAALKNWTPTDYAELTQVMVAAVWGVEELTPEDAGRIGYALEANINFRDGLIGWASDSAVEGVESFDKYPFSHPTECPDAKAVIDLMRWTAHLLPEGEAAPAIAVAAYLAWTSGDGRVARLLNEQALEEDAEYSLALLIEQALHQSIPPQWVSQR